MNQQRNDRDGIALRYLMSCIDIFASEKGCSCFLGVFLVFFTAIQFIIIPHESYVLNYIQ